MTGWRFLSRFLRVLHEEGFTFLLRDFGEICTFLDQLSELELVILLVLEQFADLEACQLTADVILGFDCVEEPERGDGLFDDGPEFEVINQVHVHLKLYIYNSIINEGGGIILGRNEDGILWDDVSIDCIILMKRICLFDVDGTLTRPRNVEIIRGRKSSRR